MLNAQPIAHRNHSQAKGYYQGTDKRRMKTRMRRGPPRITIGPRWIREQIPLLSHPPDPIRPIFTDGEEKIIVPPNRYMFRGRTLVLRGAVQWWEDRLFACPRPQAPTVPTTCSEKKSRNHRSCGAQKCGRPWEQGLTFTRMEKRRLIQYWVLPPFRGVPPILCWE